MRLIAINAKKSLAQLAVLRGIPLTKGWVKQLAGWLGVEPNSVSTWSRRTPGIPEKRIKKIEDLGYPREKWYIEEKITEEFTLGDDVTVEIKRGGNIIEPEDDDFMDCSFLQNYSSYHAAFILLRDENIHTADVVMIDYLKKKYGEKLDPQYGVEMKEEKRA